MTRSLRRRIAVLKVLSKGYEKMVEPKICCLEALYRHGWLHLSDLQRVLKNEYNVKVSIGWLHRYIQEMKRLNVVKCERLPNKVLISLRDLEVADWLLGDVTLTNKERVDAVNYLLQYLTTFKRKWDNVFIRGRSRQIPLPEYAKKLVIELSSIAVDPPKQIALLCRIMERLNLKLDVESVKRSKGKRKSFIGAYILFPLTP